MTLLIFQRGHIHIVNHKDLQPVPVGSKIDMAIKTAIAYEQWKKTQPIKG